MMLTMETRLQNHMQSNPVTLYNSVKPSGPLDSTTNGGDWQEEVYQEIKTLKGLYLLDLIARNPNGEDWREEVYQKIKAMKDLYLPDLNYMHQKLLSKSQWAQTAAPQQQAQALPPQHMQSLQQSQQSHLQLTQVQSHGNQMNLQRFMAQTPQSNKLPLQQQNQQRSENLLPTQVQQSQPQLQQPVMPHMQSQPGQLQQRRVGMQQWRLQLQYVIDLQKQRTMPMASNSTTQTDNPNGGDWQEEVYQKIKAMKGLYQLDLIVMYQKTLSILRQHDYLPWQPKNAQLSIEYQPIIKTS